MSEEMVATKERYVHPDVELGVRGDNMKFDNDRNKFYYDEVTDHIDFLSLELTNQCNLQCLHCYANAGQRTNINSVLARFDYENLIKDGVELGAKKVQFIGGEPTLNKDLPYLISFAHYKGYEFIEVFSNLIGLTDELIDCYKEYDVRVATSVYAPCEEAHDQITCVKGSFRKTIKNLRRLLDEGVGVRVGVIEMEQNEGLVEETKEMLRNLGVVNIGGDKLRRVGRGDDGTTDELTELCGGCNGKTLCIGPDGAVSPCIMSKKMSVGSVIGNTLSEVIESEKLASLKHELDNKKGMYAICTPKTCVPYSTCSPKTGPGPCEPRPYSSVVL